MIKLPKDHKKRRAAKLFILLLFEIVFLSSFSMSIVNANPQAAPAFFHNMEIGLNNSEKLPIKHCSAEVKIDVYDELSYGCGKYVLRNLANESVNSLIIFSSGDYGGRVDEAVLGIFINGTPLESHEYRGGMEEITIIFEPLTDIELQIDWVFRSSIEDENLFGVFFLENRRYYFTGYQINGGNHWNNTPIDHESVQFCFHTDKFMIDDSQIAVKYTNASLNPLDYDDYKERDQWTKDTEKISLTIDSDGNKSYTFSYENIMDDIAINIMNNKSSLSLSGWGYFTLIIVGLIGVSIVLKLNRRVKSNGESKITAKPSF